MALIGVIAGSHIVPFQPDAKEAFQKISVQMGPGRNVLEFSVEIRAQSVNPSVSDELVLPCFTQSARRTIKSALRLRLGSLAL
jgi:hypothetical protein